MLNRRRNHIREKVETLLAESGITEPKVPVERIAVRYGIDVRMQPIDEDISGFLLRQAGEQGAIIGLNSNHSPTRRRFTLAHELAHFFLHGDQGQQEVHIDRTSRFQVKLRDPASSQGIDQEEIEANVFAAELLMPARFLERDFIEHDGFDLSDDDHTAAALAKRYGVSAQAMSFRLANLGKLTLT